ncbi:hypothetical protein ACS0TY_000817 [Phlomoides rotata]
MKYIRLHKCQDDPSLLMDGNDDFQDSPNGSNKVKSIMEAMHRLVSPRPKKNRASEDAVLSGSNTSQPNSQKK